MTFHGQPTGYRLSDFWRWYSSDLLNNTLRGAYAEFIVSSALGAEIRKTYEDWTPWDITVPAVWTDPAGAERIEIRAEVKSSAYLQSWPQKKFSRIVFGIRPTLAWSETAGYESDPHRQSDVYIFCLYRVKDRTRAEPLDLDGWTFYVLPTAVLDELCGRQKTITLPSLLRLKPVETDYAGIADAVKLVLGIER